ncbi:MAG TPA: bifunctional 5,10-methylenetetrahydrofolate dehydrogenase/5,10-methenyltetrahydrofolate cyclohydrolase [Candidatus Limnocylindria bacterium]|nr:bifunctional 5,10-methylenetetrahydrofolate dehydrogenase/5,10-methenyltetrahydrofolate cyclohydrolase [Candidatus Limnocylindria bacterium]
MARILHGRPVAERIAAATEEAARALARRGVRPTLAVVEVGNDPAARTYASRLERAGKNAGVAVRLETLPKGTAEADLGAKLDALGADRAVHGVILLTPLPPPLGDVSMDERIPVTKDVDGQHPLSAGRLMDGRPRFVPSTAEAAVELLRYYEVPLAGARVTIVGRSMVVGRPLANLLLLADSTVTLAHSRTRELARHTRDADVVVVAVGKPGFLTPEMVSPGSVVIDAGINVTPSGIVGDADEGIASVVEAYSPVPGGLGTVTTALLVRNVVRAAEGAAA